MSYLSLVKTRKEFSEAVQNYRAAIERSFNSRHGEEWDDALQKANIVRLYRASSPKLRMVMKYTALRTLSRPAKSVGNGAADSKRLTNRLRNLADELLTELEKPW